MHSVCTDSDLRHAFHAPALALWEQVKRLQGLLRQSREQLTALMRSESEHATGAIATAGEVAKSWEQQKAKFEEDLLTSQVELEVM